MAALKVTTTMASSTSTPSSILRTKHPPHKWVRTLSPLTTTTTTTTAYATTTSGSSSPTSARTLVMSKSSAFINRKNGERMSVWWRDGWRLISCADFGQKNRTFLPQKPSFPSSQSSSQSSNNMGGASENKEEDQHQQQQPAPKLLTIPTILTLGRVAAIPLLIATFYSNSWWATTLTTSIFVAAAITDWLDGYLARKMRLGTPFGAFLDPVADKLMVAATLVLLCTRPLEFGAFGEISWLLPIPSIAIIGREITMSAVREWAASQNGKVLEAVAVNNLGKWKTASQMTALTILLATRDTSIVGSHILVPSGVALLYISAGLAVWSLAVYMKKIWRILLKL